MTWTIRRKHHFCVWLLFALSLSGCDWLQRAPQSGLDDSGVDSVFEIRTNLNKGLVENSVGVTSVRQPGIIFGMNDSGPRAPSICVRFQWNRSRNLAGR
jgi:hypothetical protein